MTRGEEWMHLSVPRLGNVLFSAEVIAQLQDEKVTDDELQDVLLKGKDVRARTDKNLVGREYRGVRLVIRTRPHMEGAAAVCINGYRVKSDA